MHVSVLTDRLEERGLSHRPHSKSSARARAAASVLFRAPRVAWMVAKWVFTVAGERPSEIAISLFDRPSAARRRTLSCRSLRGRRQNSGTAGDTARSG